MRKLFTLAAACAAAVAMIVTPAGAVTGNFVEDFDHPFVGLVAFYDADGEFMWRCSGSLLEDKVTFVTAGHCTDQNAAESPVSARIWFRQDAGEEFDGVQDPDTGYPETCITDDPERADDVCVTSTKLYDYGYDNFAGFPNHRDLGVILLDNPVQLPEYGRLPSPNLLTNLAATTKKNSIWLTASGYGIQRVRPTVVSVRERLMADERVVNLHNSLTDGFNVQSTANPGGGKGGTCFGDSGGPVFLRGTNTIVSVTSFGLNPNCKGLDFSYRIDRPETLAWIANPSN
jgi:hypothetical protein